MPSALPALALLVNAFVWGISWWPFRLLDAQGWHPLWATSAVYGLALVGTLAWRPALARTVVSHRGLWLLAAAAGLTNTCFNWGVTQGDVVRVVLLFYLMPLWSVLLAWPILGERPRPMALVRVALALAGVIVVLKTPATPWPVPNSLPDWLGVAGGFAFALTNILLRRMNDTPETARTAAMFLGGFAMAALVATGGAVLGSIALPAMPSAAMLQVAVPLALGFLASNLALQYGASRLPAGVTALVMLSEVVFASGSSVLVGAAELAPHVLVGAAMVLAAAAWSALSPQARQAPH